MTQAQRARRKRQRMPKSTTYQEWYDRQVARNGQGSVEIERKKLYNKKADLEQYDSYVDRLGADAPDSFTAFQVMKYSQPEAWAETKSFYSYKGRVPEATKADFGVYKICLQSRRNLVPLTLRARSRPNLAPLARRPQEWTALSSCNQSQNKFERNVIYYGKN